MQVPVTAGLGPVEVGPHGCGVVNDRDRGELAAILGQLQNIDGLDRPWLSTRDRAGIGEVNRRPRRVRGPDENRPEFHRSAGGDTHDVGVKVPGRLFTGNRRRGRGVVGEVREQGLQIAAFHGGQITPAQFLDVHPIRAHGITSLGIDSHGGNYRAASADERDNRRQFSARAGGQLGWRHPSG